MFRRSEWMSVVSHLSFPRRLMNRTSGFPADGRKSRLWSGIESQVVGWEDDEEALTGGASRER